MTMRAYGHRLSRRLRTVPPRQTPLVAVAAALAGGAVAAALADAWRPALAVLALLLLVTVVAVQQVRQRTVSDYAALRDALHAARRDDAERRQWYEEMAQRLTQVEEQQRRLLAAVERERLDAADFREECRAQGNRQPAAD